MECSTKDLHYWRIIAAVSCSILVQLIILCIFIVYMNLDLWTLNVFSASFQSLLSMKFLYILPLAAIILFQGIIYSRDYLKPPKAQFIGKRFLIIMNVFSLQNLSALSVHVFLGYAISLCYSSLSSEHFNSIRMKCSPEQPDYFSHMCLNEKKFFLLLGGVWIGFYTFLKDYIFHSKTLIFPPVQQHKFIRVKAALLPCLKNCMVKAIFPSLLFCFLYYFKGNACRSYFCSLVHLSTAGDPLDTLFIFLDKELITYLWLYSTIFILTIDVMVIFFNIHLTERAYFSITSFMLVTPDSNMLFLQDALASDAIPIIQHLGFLDLALLAQYDSQRRAELFTLSQPGGHPHSWNGISCQCFKIIDKFTEELDQCIGIKETEKGNKTDEYLGKKLDSSLHHCHHHSYRMRNLSVMAPDELIESSPMTVLQQSYKRFVKVYQSWWNSVKDAFCKKPIIMYFFGEMSEPKIKHLLFQSQPVMWAVESLSFLACNSIEEDTFGIAQKDLTRIISSLLHLKNSLDKLHKQSMFIKKTNKLNLVDIQMKNALKFSVKQSLYRIAIAFKSYIKEINLSPVEKHLQMVNFIEFKEV